MAEPKIEDFAIKMMEKQAILLSYFSSTVRHSVSNKSRKTYYFFWEKILGEIA
ncbi:hypothetical protein KA005_14020 [bacterium]|jgi:hypothetical protein|nr:hypothetical protein [bacterium]